MFAAAPSSEYTILHLPAGSDDWGPMLAQFTLQVAAQDGRAYAGWLCTRLTRMTRTADAVVALVNGELHGLLLFEADGRSLELTLPWTKAPNAALECELALAAVQTGREAFPDIRYIRAERQLLPGQNTAEGLEQAGFICHWRKRMQLELLGWNAAATMAPGYRLGPWHIRHLDAAADAVFRANDGTLDAQIYAPFFGDSPDDCRKGLLAIFAGRYGAVHPEATLCAFRGTQLAGINIVLAEGQGIASVIEISVAPPYQRQGLGRLLMVRSLRILQERHVERVELAVTRANTRAVQLYGDLGFHTASEFPVCIWPS